ncbi:uncharacterized protein [Hoplias malabaricus]|uniref:uncharacterized protein n=1 Tax=Hoplias malabaricus TaxID=27720 RepID=UPI003461CD67
MDTLIYTLFVLLHFTNTSGFLIVHSNKDVCLVVQEGIVLLHKCDSEKMSQNWSWTPQMKLFHPQSSRCLWANTSSTLPSHVRLVQLSDCSRALVWKCYDQRGTFGLAHFPMFLKKQGERALIRTHPRYSNWTTYSQSEQGKVKTSLCQLQGISTASTEKTALTTTARIPVTTAPGTVTHVEHKVRPRTKRTSTTGIVDTAGTTDYLQTADTIMGSKATVGSTDTTETTGSVQTTGTTGGTVGSISSIETTGSVQTTDITRGTVGSTGTTKIKGFLQTTGTTSGIVSSAETTETRDSVQTIGTMRGTVGTIGTTETRVSLQTTGITRGTIT